MRRIVLPLLLLCGCKTTTLEQQEMLTACQRNAPIYFEGGKLEQAMIQAERGLEIDPDDYKLNAIKGAILLRASEDSPKLLDEATAQLAEVYDRRSPRRHEPYVLLYYGLAQQKQGLRNLGEAIRLEDRARRVVEKRDEYAAAAAAQRELADARLAEADELLGHLLDLGSLLRIAHKHRLQIALQRGDDREFEASAKAFLKESAEEQKFVRGEVERTQAPEYEAEQYAYLRELRDEEIEVRALYANWLFDQKQLEGTLAQLDRVLELDPKRSNDYYNRGRVLMALRRTDAAKRDFRMFLSTSSLPDDNERKTYAVQALRQ
jgi:tetratricopeptide (TPR) repeat protein